MTEHMPLLIVNVGLDFGGSLITVGRLAAKNRRVYFEYDAGFLKRGLALSPFRLPLKSGVQEFDPGLFDGLPGVFNDSLPDGWGRLLLDRALRVRGILPGAFTPLDRLAHVGRHGMGALVYQPDYSGMPSQRTVDLDELSQESRHILEGESSDVLEMLLALNGSSAGARPKAMIGVNAGRTNIIQGVDELPEGFEHWLVKFPNMADGIDSGAVEFIYNQMAREAGLDVMECHLFSAKKGPGYFATKRFDRLPGNRRLHKHTASGLLHADFRVPSLDYQDLVRGTMALTRDMREAQKMFRLAVFNVLSHNRDDHAKNFSFLMDEHGKWSMAPAYDLMYSAGPGGEQSTLVMGEGKDPGTAQLLELAAKADLPIEEAKIIIDQTRHALNRWKILAHEIGVSSEMIDLIHSVMARTYR